MQKHILMVEDDIHSGGMIKNQLEKWGFEVEWVTNGEDAVNALEKAPCCYLVLMDWVLPDCEGIDVMIRHRNKENVCRHYIIFLSSRAKQENMIDAFEKGADDYVSKPFYLPLLHSRINAGFRLLELQFELNNRIKELESAKNEIKQLQKIIPICMYCHKIRTDKEIWEKLETYITDNYNTMVSHGICPDCYKKINDKE